MYSPKRCITSSHAYKYVSTIYVCMHLCVCICVSDWLNKRKCIEICLTIKLFVNNCSTTLNGYFFTHLGQIEIYGDWWFHVRRGLFSVCLTCGNVLTWSFVFCVFYVDCPIKYCCVNMDWVYVSSYLDKYLGTLLPTYLHIYYLPTHIST